MTDLLSGLNIKQFEAVTTRSKAVLVLAGAGSGKTGVLTKRIAYLIQERGVSPHNILALTFTRKAANEMKERLTTLLGEKDVRKCWIGTFHSISLRILEQFGAKLGYSSHISVYDEVDRADVIGAIVNEFGLTNSVKTKHVVGQFAEYASDCDGKNFEEPFGTIMTEYRNRLKSYNAIDFSLLLTETLELFRSFPDVFEYYHNKFQYVFVDEYQDVDRTQYYLHEALKPNNIFVVGDHDQSIYGWRGSDIQIVLDFEKTHTPISPAPNPSPEETPLLISPQGENEMPAIIKLEQSYRCPANVIDAANSLIGKNSQRYEKTLWTENERGTIMYKRYETSEKESEFIVAQIQALTQTELHKPGQIAILARTHNYHQTIVAALKEKEIPYKLVGNEINFWKTTGARILISILKVLRNPKDSYNFQRLSKTIIYEMTDVEWLECETLALKDGRRTIDVVLEYQRGQNPEFEELLKWYAEQQSVSFSEALEKILETYSIADYLTKRDLFSKAAQLDYLPQHVAEWEKISPEDVSVVSFLGWLAEQDVQSEVDESDSVKVATIHAVKGLEFPVVFVAGMNEGLMPHKRSITDGDVEEERRLCYVAITRAGRRLYLSGTSTVVAGMKSVPAEQSRFLLEMGTAYGS